MTTEPIHPGWNQLLGWLVDKGASVSAESIPIEARITQGAGYGLVARQDLQASSKLLKIPTSALLNKMTLAPFYPRTARKLSAVQLISLHLYVNCPIALDSARLSENAAFVPYISVLPRDFSFHPLTWLYAGKNSHACNELLKDLSSGVRSKLLARADSLLSDWTAVRDYLKANRSVQVNENVKRSLDSSTDPVDENYVWAWLIVNTRSIFCRLNYVQSHEDNITLAPIVDFANHIVSETSLKVDFSKEMGGDLILSLPKDHAARMGDELFLTYGRHPSSTLFVDYGFIDPNRLQSGEGEEVDLTEPVKSLFEKRGEFGLYLKKVLEDHQYWGDWTVYLLEEPAYPSFRLITALRLYHLYDLSISEIPVDIDTKLRLWEDTLFGRRHLVDPRNEAAWRLTLRGVCLEEVEHARARLACLTELQDQLEDPGMTSSVSNVKILCEGEIGVCLAICQSIENGVEF